MQKALAGTAWRIDAEYVATTHTTVASSDWS
jgi:hypothetical protein